MTSKGEVAKIDKAKKMIIQASVGVLIIFSSYAIATFVINAILKATGAGGIAGVGVVEKYKEPLAGALGAGIVESHYPPRNAIDIPRDTMIFITFKEAINPSDIISGDGDLNANNVWIFATEEGNSKKLVSDEVKVSTNEQKTIFVFDPVDLLGNPIEDTNYTVSLQPGIKKANGQNAFVGAYSSGYGWTFEVSTEVDLTPPKVVSVIPTADSEEARNVTVEITFNEAMNPVSSTGSYTVGKDPLFTNITIVQKDGTVVQGTYEISNAYKTVGFTSTDACSKDPCGDVIYCLPGNADLTVTGKAATLDSSNPPKAQLIGVSFDGLTDASGNSLDGNGDGVACGSANDTIECGDKAQLNDNYAWSFKTTNDINDTIPQITTLKPDVGGQEIDQNAPLEISFNSLLKAATVNSTNVSVWPDKFYQMWFSTTKEDDVTAKTSKVLIDHPAFISKAEKGYDYYPVVTNGLKSSYQICVYPSMQTGSSCNGSNSGTPYCCNGNPSATACKTQLDQKPLPGNE